jgi:hypothetical protein
VAEIGRQFPALPAWQLQRNLAWLAKMEAIRITPP